MKRESFVAAQAGLAKLHETTEDGGAVALLALLEDAVGPIRRGASILDLGCGIGKCVRTLLDRGYDAHGVDVYEFWGRDRDLYWEPDDPVIPDQVKERLRFASLDPYKLPFPDDSFDHIVSNQVLEHVDDLSAVFGEIARTLRPGGTSIHIFPGRWAPPIEGHIGVPFPVLCDNRAYLKAMAMVGFRSPRQHGLGWREVYRTNSEQMKITHYPRRGEVLAKARGAGLNARFIHDSRNVRPAVGQLYRGLTAMGLDTLARTSVMMLQQPRLLLSRPDKHGHRLERSSAARAG